MTIMKNKGTQNSPSIVLMSSGAEVTTNVAV